jgi:hypothetical protein
MENNEKQNDSKSPNDNFLKLFFSKRFLSIRILVLTSVLSSILLLTPISVFFSCQLSVFQNVVIPFMGTLMYLVKARFGTYSQRLKESGLVGGMIGLTSAGSYVLIRALVHERKVA